MRTELICRTILRPITRPQIHNAAVPSGDTTLSAHRSPLVIDMTLNRQPIAADWSTTKTGGGPCIGAGNQPIRSPTRILYGHAFPPPLSFSS